MSMGPSMGSVAPGSTWPKGSFALVRDLCTLRRAEPALVDGDCIERWPTPASTPAGRAAWVDGAPTNRLALDGSARVEIVDGRLSLDLPAGAIALWTR